MAEEEKVEEVEESEGRSGRLMLIFGLVGGLAVGGGGTFYYTTQMAAQDGEAVEEVVEEEEAEPEPEEVIDVRYLYIERLPAGITDQRGNVIGYVFLTFSLETRDPDEQSYVSERLPVIMDAFNKDISEYGITRADKPGAIDYDGVTSRLKDVANTLLGREMIYGVYITNALRAPG